MRRLPLSPSRSQALIQFEPHLIRVFERLTAKANREVRDAMHYALFSAKDRFCISAAWLVAPRLSLSFERFAPIACAVETLRCSLELKLLPKEKLVEPPLAEAASYGLIPLAFEMVLDDRNALSSQERAQLAMLLAQAASPVHLLSALHRESRLSRESHAVSRSELIELHQEKVAPTFQVLGSALAILSGRDQGALSSWFGRLGLFAHWIEEFSANSKHPLAITQAMSLPEAMDVIKSLEAELLEQAKALGIRDAAHDILEPVAEMLRTQLQ